MKIFKSLLKPINYHFGYKFLSQLSRPSFLPENLSGNYEKALPNIISNITHGEKYLKVLGIEDKIQKAAEYNIRTENNLGGATLLHVYNSLEKTENITTESLQPVIVLAWAVEMMLSHNLIMENKKAITVEDAEGIRSANDAELLRSFLNIMLEKHFDGYSQYTHFLRLFNKAFLYNALARNMEHATSTSSKPHFDFTIKRHNMVCEYKTAYPSFALPLSIVMKLTYRTEEKLCSRVDRLCSDMGKLYKIKKEFKNCFGGETVIGTGGTDIQQGRCTWLAATALQRFTPRQRLVFNACYGNDAPAHVERIKLLYKQVQLPQLFQEFQTAICYEIRQKAAELEKDDFPSRVFLDILDEIVRDEDVSNQKPINQTLTATLIHV